MPALQLLTADLALTADGDAVLEAAASTRAEAPETARAAMAEVATLLAWCHAQHPGGHGPREEGGLWHHALHTTQDADGWHSLHLTIVGDAAFMAALVQAHFPDLDPDLDA